MKLSFVVLAGLTFGCIPGNSSQDSPANAQNGVVMLGDSIFATNDHRTSKLISAAIGEPVEDHSYTGPWAYQVEAEYSGYMRNKHPRIVIADGGGNDVLGSRGQCWNSIGDDCKRVIQSAVQHVQELFQKLASDGVKKVVFMGCHHPIGGQSGFNAAVDYSYTLLGPLCQQAPLPCVLVDPRASLDPHPELIGWDGVHPTWQGSEVLANLLIPAVKN